MSESLTIPRMVRLGWSLRGVDRADIHRFSLPVRSHVSSGGALVLLTDEPDHHVVARALDAEGIRGRDER